MTDSRHTIPVVFDSFNPDSPNRGYWDQGIVEDIIAGRWAEPGRPRFHTCEWPDTDGEDTIVLVTAAHFDETHVPHVRRRLAAHQHVLWILTSDEEGHAPWRDCVHDGVRVWRQTPTGSELDDPTVRPFPLGYPHRIRQAAWDYWTKVHTGADRDYVWGFAGQETHERRSALVDALRRREDPGIIVRTNRFAAGLSYPEYVRIMAETRVVPSPSGPLTPEAFRTYEAYELGAVPIPDGTSPRGDDGATLAARIMGAPVYTQADWTADSLNHVLDIGTNSWPATQHQVWSRYQQWGRRLVRRLWADIDHVGRPDRSPDGQITVLIPTSPIPEHPHTSVIRATIGAVREQLPTAPIVLMFDGVRPEQEHRRHDYDRYLTAMLWMCAHGDQADPAWGNITPYVASKHMHQAALTRTVLNDPDLVTTPTVLFVEHDTPLVGEIPWEEAVGAVTDGINVLRFYPEAELQPAHEHLFDGPATIRGLPVMLTRQWSQRPHLAGTRFYRRMLDTYAGWESRTMIEDLVHGACENGDRTEWKVGIYTPDGNIQRSTHLDARGEDPKYPMEYAYDGDTLPPGAPRATAERPASEQGEPEPGRRP